LDAVKKREKKKNSGMEKMSEKRERGKVHATSHGGERKSQAKPIKMRNQRLKKKKEKDRRVKTLRGLWRFRKKKMPCRQKSGLVCGKKRKKRRKGGGGHLCPVGGKKKKRHRYPAGA